MVPRVTAEIDAMPDARRDDLTEQEQVAATDASRIAELLVTVEALETANAKLRAERRPSVPEWMALKSVPRGPYSYEAVRQWCVAGLIIAEKRRGRRFVQVGSMVDRLKELAASGR
jgi:hypothetical protein